MAVNFKQFLSGTDIRGTAVETENSPISLTDEVCYAISAAFGSWLSDKTGKPADELVIAVGHDSRISADRVCAAIFSGLTASGITVLDCGLSSTPAMFMITKQIYSDSGKNTDGAIQITASHHPFDRNGMKFFTGDGGLDAADVAIILKLAATGTKPLSGRGKVIACDFMAEYTSILREIIKKGVNAENYDKPLYGFHIVVDAGNGAGGFFATEVLERLGADIEGSQFLEPDGLFPNHIPNPEDETAMRYIKNATLSNKAHLGVIFDTDVDRAGCVAADGEEINRNRLVALAAALAIEICPGGTIVTDSTTSDGLSAFIEQTLGGRHHRFKRGYKNVINEAVRLNKDGTIAPLAAETSGHVAFADNYFLDDGAYLIVRIIIKMAQLAAENKTLNDLLAKLDEPAQSVEYRYNILGDDWRSTGLGALERFAELAAEKGWEPYPDNHEGYRVMVPEFKGWLLLRMSVHDPVMPLNIESNIAGGVEMIMKQLEPFFLAEPNLKKK